jgi:hypothetical protein
MINGLKIVVQLNPDAELTALRKINAVTETRYDNIVCPEIFLNCFAFGGRLDND